MTARRRNHRRLGPQRPRGEPLRTAVDAGGRIGTLERQLLRLCCSCPRSPGGAGEIDQPQLAGGGEQVVPAHRWEALFGELPVRRFWRIADRLPANGARFGSEDQFGEGLRSKTGEEPDFRGPTGLSPEIFLSEEAVGLAVVYSTASQPWERSFGSTHAVVVVDHGDARAASGVQKAFALVRGPVVRASITWSRRTPEYIQATTASICRPTSLQMLQS